MAVDVGVAEAVALGVADALALALAEGDGLAAEAELPVWVEDEVGLMPIGWVL